MTWMRATHWAKSKPATVHWLSLCAQNAIGRHCHLHQIYTASFTQVASCLRSCTLTRTHHSHSLRAKNHLVEKLSDYSVRPLQRQGQGLGRVGNVSTVHTHAQSQIALISAPSLYVWP